MDSFLWLLCADITWGKMWTVFCGCCVLILHRGHCGQFFVVVVLTLHRGQCGQFYVVVVC